MRIHIALVFAVATDAFVSSPSHSGRRRCPAILAPGPSSTSSSSSRSVPPSMSTAETSESSSSAAAASTVRPTSFPPILDELRDVAMRLHTREQAPREGKAEASPPPREPYVPTIMDYLRFLVDSHAIYEAMEEIVNRNDKLAMFRETGIERTAELERDIAYVCEKFDLVRPDVGYAGTRYAGELRSMVVDDEGDVPEFVCHYYNYYFAHLAGGRMIGKQMSKLLLDGETLEFYKVSESAMLYIEALSFRSSRFEEMPSFLFVPSRFSHAPTMLPTT